jgi:hypothetical protein
MQKPPSKNVEKIPDFLQDYSKSTPGVLFIFRSQQRAVRPREQQHFRIRPIDQLVAVGR